VQQARPVEEFRMGSTGKPVIFFHVGEPKTGTTFLQQVLWQNRPALASRGVALPGHRSHDHFRATLDLRDIPPVANHPEGSWAGEWDILAAQAKRSPNIVVISHELFAAATPAQAARAVQSLAPAEVHIILTVRDIATLLPAEWQETVKHRNTTPWPDWLVNVIDREYAGRDRRGFWFWKVHNTAALLEMWGQLVPPERLHIVTKPPSGAPSDLLWRRFASVIGVDPDAVDISKARANSSLGVPETEALRHLNAAIGKKVPKWYYARNVKELLAHRVWEKRRSKARLRLPVDREAWAKEYADMLVTTIRQRGYHVAGDLDDLYPKPSTGPSLEPHEVPIEQVLELACDAATTFLVNNFRETQRKSQARKGGPVQHRRGPRSLAARFEAAAGRSPKFKKTVRDLSSRYPAVRRMRILVWRVFGGAGGEPPQA
jgi:hypothetical protein